MWSRQCSEPHRQCRDRFSCGGQCDATVVPSVKGSAWLKARSSVQRGEGIRLRQEAPTSSSISRRSKDRASATWRRTKTNGWSSRSPGPERATGGQGHPLRALTGGPQRERPSTVRFDCCVPRSRATIRDGLAGLAPARHTSWSPTTPRAMTTRRPHLGLQPHYRLWRTWVSTNKPAGWKRNQASVCKNPTDGRWLRVQASGLIRW